jgi:hypothetical protein
MAKNEIPEDALQHFTRLISSHPEMEQKGGGKMQYTSMNGNMYTLLGKTGAAGFRLNDEDAAAFIAKYDSGPLIQYGSVVKGYVVIPPQLLPDTDELAPWLAKSHKHVKTLKPKPAK